MSSHPEGNPQAPVVPATKKTSGHGHHLHVAALFRDAQDVIVSEVQEAGKITLDVMSGALPDHFRELAEAASDVVLLDVDLNSAHELASLEGFLQRNPGKPVVVTAANPSIPGLRHLMRLGVRDVVPHPVTAPALTEALKAAAALPAVVAPRARGLGTVVCFLKGGGGTGATTLAAQGACALALHRPKDKDEVHKKDQAHRKEKSGADKTKVCLIDLDIQFGGVAHQLDVDAAATVADLLAKSDHIDGSMIRTAAARHRSGIDVLVAPPAVQPLDSIAPHAAARLVEAARGEYEHVLVDLPGAWTIWTRAVLEAASSIVVVMRPTVPSIRQTKRQIQTLVEENLGDIPLTIVANYAERGLFRRQISLKDVEKALDHPVAYTVGENSLAMAEAANSGLLLNEVRKGRRAWKEIADLMSRIMNAARAADRPIAALAG